MIRYRLALAASCLAVAACGKASEESALGQANASTTSPAKAEPTLYGRWVIVAVNGSAPRRFEHREASSAYLVFSPSSYSGSTGCNGFSGTGLLVGQRWFGEPAMATQQGCGELTAQEDAVFAVTAGGPAVAFVGEAEATLTSDKGSLRLRREAASGETVPEPELMPLAGTAWDVNRLDGNPVGVLSRRERARLVFEADRWTLDAGCAALGGPWRQNGRTVSMKVATPRPATCGPTLKAEDDALRELFAAGPSYAVGPNRELVMGAGRHWLTGQFDRRLERAGADILAGEWRVESIDGAALQPMEKPPTLRFGKASYALWNGCNHKEGVMIVLARRLFIHGSGMSTLVNCMPDPVRGRIGAIVGSKPRIAKTDAGIALVAPSGTLRLRRVSARAFGSSEQAGLRGPASITLLRRGARLVLEGGNRFAVELACGRIEGEWRGGQPARFSPDPLERTAPGCDRSDGSDAFDLSQFFTGDVHAVTGPNKDIVLLVNRDRSLSGYIPR